MNVTHDSEVDVDVPGLGTATIRARTTGFHLHFPDLTVHGKLYREDVFIDRHGKAVDISRFTTFTDAARRRVESAVLAWAPAWVQTPTADALLTATVTYQNGLNAGRVANEIADAEKHLAELHALAQRIRDAGPTEYVGAYGTTHRLTRN